MRIGTIPSPAAKPATDPDRREGGHLGRAVVERLRGRAGRLDDRLLDVQDEIDRLREQIANQDQRFEELHDRLDFAERLLVRGSVARDEADEIVTPVPEG